MDLSGFTTIDEVGDDDEIVEKEVRKTIPTTLSSPNTAADEIDLLNKLISNINSSDNEKNHSENETNLCIGTAFTISNDLNDSNLNSIKDDIPDDNIQSNSPKSKSTNFECNSDEDVSQEKSSEIQFDVPLISDVFNINSSKVNSKVFNSLNNSESALNDSNLESDNSEPDCENEDTHVNIKSELFDPASPPCNNAPDDPNFPVSISDIKVEPPDDVEQDLTSALEDPAEEFTLNPKRFVQNESNMFINPVYKYEESHDESLLNLSYIPKVYYKVAVKKGYSKEELNAALIMAKSSSSLVINMEMFSHLNKSMPHVKLVRLEKYSSSLMAFGEYEIIKLFFNKYGKKPRKWKKLFAISNKKTKKRNFIDGKDKNLSKDKKLKKKNKLTNCSENLDKILPKNIDYSKSIDNAISKISGIAKISKNEELKENCAIYHAISRVTASPLPEISNFDGFQGPELNLNEHKHELLRLSQNVNSKKVNRISKIKLSSPEKGEKNLDKIGRKSWDKKKKADKLKSCTVKLLKLNVDLNMAPEAINPHNFIVPDLKKSEIKLNNNNLKRKTEVKRKVTDKSNDSSISSATELITDESDGEKIVDNVKTPVCDSNLEVSENCDSVNISDKNDDFSNLLSDISAKTKLDSFLFSKEEEMFTLSNVICSQSYESNIEDKNLENLKKIESINLDEEHLKVIVNKCKDEKHLNFVNECKENLNEQKSFKPITKTLDTNDNKIKNNFNEYESKNQDENDYNINENAIKENMKDIKFVESKENSEIFKEVNTESASNINSKPSELKSKLSYESDNELSDSNSFHGNDSIDWDHSDNETMDGGDIKPPTNDESMLEKLISKVKQNWELIQSKEDLGIKNQLHNEDDKKMNEVNVEFCDKPSICKDSIGIDAEIRILKSHKDQLKNCNLEVSGSLKFKSNLSANIINFKNKLELFKYFGLRNCKLLLPDIAYDKLYRNKVKKLKKRLLSVNGDKSWKNLSNLDRSKCEAISNLPKAEVKHVSKKDKLPTSKSRTISSEKDVKPKLTFKDSLKLNAHIKELSKINSPKDKSFEIKDQQSKNTKACGNQEKARMITEVPLFAQSFRIPKKISKSNSAMKSALTQCSLVEKTGREKRLSYHRQPIKRKYEYPKCDDIEPTPNKHLRKDEIDDKSKIVLNFNPELLKSEIKNSGSQNRFATPIQSMARYDHNKNKLIENPNKSYVLDQSGNISRFSNKNHSLPSANDSKQLENSLSKTYHAHSSALKEPVLHTVLNHISQSPISSMKSDFIKKTDDKENILSHLNLSIVNDPQSPQVLQDSPFSPVTSIHGDDNDSASEDSHSHVTQESPDKMKAHKANLQESVEPLEKETDEVMDIKEFTEKFESMNKREKIILYKKHRKLYHEAKRSFMNESGDVYKSKIKLSKYKEMDSFRLMYNAIKSHLHKEREENDKQKQVLLDASEMEKFVTPYSPSMPTCQDEDIYKSSTKLVNDKIKNNDEASNDNCDDEPYSPSCSPLITQKYLCMPEKKRKNSQDQCFETLLPTECQDDTFVPVNVSSSFLIDASLLSNVLDNLAGSRDGPKNDNYIITETEIANTENRSTSSTSNVTKFPFEFDCRNENEEYLLKFFLGGDNERETNGTSTSISGNDDAQFTVLLNEQNVQTQNLCSTDHYICDSITGAPFIQSSAFPGVTLDLATASSHPGVVEETHENKINTSMGLSQATALLLPLPHPPPSPPSMTKLLENETTTVNGLDNRREDLTSMVNDYFQNWEPSNVPDVDVSLETDVEVVFDHVSEKKSQIMAYWEEKLYDEQPFAHELIKQIHGVPLVGLQYVLEVRKEGKQSIENCNYICSLCSKKMSSTTLVAHVKSVPHRLKYTEYFSRELHEKYGKLEVKQWTAALVKEFTSALQEVEKEYGRERMAVTSEKTMTSALTFLKEKSSSLAYKSNSNGSASSAQKAPETPKDTKSNGPAVKRDAKPKGKESPKNVPSRKPEVIVLDNDSSRPSPKTSKTAPPPARKSSPPKSVKRPDQAPGNRSNSNARDVKSKSNERDLKDRNDPRDRGDPKDRGAPKDRNDPKDRSDPRDRIDSRRPDANQPPRKRSRSPPHPPGHADRRPPRARSPLLPRPRGPPLQRGRSPPQQRGRSPPPPRARSPLLPRGRSPLLQRGRSPPPQRGRSPPPPRGRSPQPPRGLFRSRSPLVPRTRSPPRMGPRGRKDQESNLSKFRSEEQKLRADCVRVRDRYIKDPDSHPRYKMEWEKFWDRRYREVKQEGQDVNFYDFKGDWIKFFPSRICEMSNQEFVFKRDQLLNKHNVSDPNPKNKSLPEPRMDFERPNDANRKANKTEKPFPNRRPSPPQRNDFQKRKRSPSPWEANQNGRMGQTEKYEIGYSVVSTLKVLCEFEDQLGSLSTAIKSMFKKASDFNSRGANEIQIFNDPDNVVVLKLAHTKLNSLTLSGVLDVMTIARTQKAIEATDWLIKEAQKADPQSKSKMAELGVDLGHISVATMGKSTVEIAQFIAQYLLNIGKGDADESVLQEILFAVAENHKKIKSAAQSLNSRSSARNPPNPQSYSNFSKTIADNLPVNVSQVNQYEQNALFPSGTGSHPHMMQDSGSKSNALGILQNAYDDKDPKSTKKPLEYMTLDELQEMLLNFRKLDQEEQKELTEFLKRLEATDSKKVTMLRSMMRGAKPAAESARTKPDRSSRDDNERSEQHNYNQHFDRSGDSYGMQSANNSYEQNQKDNYDNEEMDHYGNYKQNDSFQNDYSRSQSKEHMQDRFGQSGFSNNSSGFGNQRSSLLSEPNSKPDYSNERGSFNQTANQGGPFHQSTNQGGSFNESRSSFGSRGALLSTPYQGSGDLSGFDKSYSSIDQDYEDKGYKSSSRNSLLPDPENDAERSESNWYGKSFSENSSKDSPFSQSSSSFMNKEYRISESFGDYSSRGQSGAGSGPFDRGSRGGRDGDRGRSEFSQPEYQSNFNATRGSSRGFGASQRGNDKSRDPSRGQSGPYHSGYKAPSPADEDDMGSFQSSRGRGGSSRGGDTFRGRGDFSRGRGDFSRGRGDASRGGDFSRGRGDPSRGRGGGSYHSSFKASPGDRGSFRGSRGPRRPSRGFRGN